MSKDVLLAKEDNHKEGWNARKNEKLRKVIYMGANLYEYWLYKTMSREILKYIKD